MRFNTCKKFNPMCVKVRKEESAISKTVLPVTSTCSLLLTVTVYVKVPALAAVDSAIAIVKVVGVILVIVIITVAAVSTNG